MSRRETVVASMVILAGVAAGPVAYVSTAPSEPAKALGSSSITVELKPCQSEDSEGCYWDSHYAGNREGDSFIRVKGETHAYGSLDFTIVDGAAHARYTLIDNTIYVVA